MNRKSLFLGLCLLCVSFFAMAQHRADRQQLTDAQSFSMILLGAPQGYIKYDIN